MIAVAAVLDASHQLLGVRVEIGTTAMYLHPDDARSLHDQLDRVRTAHRTAHGPDEKTSGAGESG